MPYCGKLPTKGLLHRVRQSLAIIRLAPACPLRGRAFATTFFCDWLSATGNLQDKFVIAGSKRRTANQAFDFAVAGFRSGFCFDNLIKRLAVGALEKRISHGSSHGEPSQVYAPFLRERANVNSRPTAPAVSRRGHKTSAQYMRPQHRGTSYPVVSRLAGD